MCMYVQMPQWCVCVCTNASVMCMCMYKCLSDVYVYVQMPQWCACVRANASGVYVSVTDECATDVYERVTSVV